MEPKVSVIIPVYNVEKYLGECLDSVLGQTLKDIEVVCVDDGSTDGSPEILRHYAAKDHRIKVITQKNGGVSRARNVGIQQATGQYLMFVDSDDYIAPKSAEKVWKAAEGKDADIVVFGGKSFPTVAWIDNRMTIRGKIYENRSVEALMEERASRPFACNKAFRRSLLVEHGIEFDENLALGEDHAFLFDVFPLVKRIVYIEDCLYYYRQDRDESAMSQYGANVSRRLNGHVKMLQHIYESWNNSGLMEREEARFLNWAIPYLYDDTSALCYDATVKVAETVCAWMQERDGSKLTEEVRQKVQKLRDVLDSAGKAPVVTVIVPVYNAEKYIGQCVESLLSQSLQHFEMIFVDDGSKDRSVEILQQYQAADRRITLLQQQHEFAGAARNRAMKQAKGTYLLFLDADDFFEPTLLEKSVAQIEAYQADVCVFRADSYDQKKRAYVPMPWTCNVSLVPQGQVFNHKTEPRNIYCFTTPAPWTKLFRRAFVEQYGLEFQKIRSANDLKFIFSALALAERVVVLDECLVHYRVNTGTSLQQTQDKDPMTFYEALKALRQELKGHGVYQELEAPYKNFALDCCLYNLNTLKSRKNFEQLYFRLKNEIFDKLDLNGHDESYFYAHKFNRIYEKREDINQMGLLEYVEKYHLFSAAPVDGGGQVEELRRQLEDIRASKSYRIGRMITKIPRMIRGGLRCIQENGMAYTVGHLCGKVKNRCNFGKGK